MKFAKKNYKYSKQLNANELSSFNEICDLFIIGGDQVWNYTIPFVKEDVFLNFVDEDKTKISYSSLFGSVNHKPTSSYIKMVKPLLKRFDAISVREDYAVDIAKNKYDVEATQVIDAVFLLDKEEYVKISSDFNFKFPKNFLFAYILNPTIEKKNQIQEIARKLNLKIVCCHDAASASHKVFNEIFSDVDVISVLSVSNFLKAYEKALYIVTDSFHGVCMCYIYKKDFSVYFNEKRGSDRFMSLMKILDLNSRRIYESDGIQKIINNKEIGFNTNWKSADKYF